MASGVIVAESSHTRPKSMSPVGGDDEMTSLYVVAAVPPVHAPLIPSAFARVTESIGVVASTPPNRETLSDARFGMSVNATVTAPPPGVGVP